MWELVLQLILDLLCLTYVDELDDGWRLLIKILIYLLFIIGVIALIYYLFIRP